MMKQTKVLPVILIAFRLSIAVTEAQTPAIYNIRDFGARGDGVTIDTRAIDSVISTANSKGGGTVWIPAGNYLSVTIHLKSNISLYLDQGATVIAAANGYDDPERNANEIYQDYGHSHFNNSLIVGSGLENISILGPGKLWGKGLLRDTVPLKKENGLGNKTISLEFCHNVTLRDFSVLHGGWFALLLNAVDNLTIDNLKMDTNRDGMDIISCKNVRVSNCLVNSPQDDGICLKSDYALGFPRVTENVMITNCQVSGYDEGSLLDGTFRLVAHTNRTGRIKLGTESNGGFRNITIANCVFDYIRGLALETVDGAILEDITITNITMRNIVNSPLFIRLGERMRGPADAKMGELRRVSISHIIAYNIDGSQSAFISGTPGHQIEDLFLSDIHFYFKGKGTADQAKINVPEMEKEYPEPGRFGKTPAYGFFIRHVKGLNASDISVAFMADDQRPAFFLDHVDHASFSRISARRVGDNPGIVLKNVTSFKISDSAPLADMTVDRASAKVL